MSKTYRPWNPDQDWLLPPSPREWLPEGDLVYFMLDVGRTLDLSAITRRYEKEDRGFPPYHPRLMVTLIEPIFGQIKQVRGFRQFLLRGLEKMRGEWRLICLTHNLKKLFRKGFAGITRTANGRWAPAGG